ncbi:MAG TPA: hypothetical protein VGD40_22335 [Chryseosolibacter sp.]
MKSFVTFAFVGAATIVVVFLLFMNESDQAELAERIHRYEAQADSLKKAVRQIDSNIHQKDSILLAYLTSLDKTLEELNKESAKNKEALRLNFAKQDSVRAAYCREMKSLQQHPEECQ